MGSSLSCFQDPREVATRSRRRTYTFNYINRGLSVFRQYALQDMKAKPLTINTFLLKFQVMYDVFNSFHDIFELHANKESKLSKEGLDRIFKDHGIEVPEDQLSEMYAVAGLSGAELGFREFMVSILISFVLNFIPGVNITQCTHWPSQKELLIQDGEVKDEIDLFHQPKVHCVMKMLLRSYLLFDPEAKGYISKSSIKEVFSSALGGSGGTDQFLSEERMNEMDWDANNKVDFEEFSFCFISWVLDTKHDEEEDEEEDEEGKD